MTWIAAISLASAAVATQQGLLALRFGVAHGWRAQRAFAWVAFTAAGAIACNLVNTVPAPDAVVVWCFRAQLGLLLLHAAAWLGFTARQLDAPLRGERWVLWGLVAAAPACLVPGLAFTDRVVHRPIEHLGLTYPVIALAPVGVGLIGATLAIGAVVTWRYLHAWRRGETSAGLLAAAILALSLMSVNDALVTSGVLKGIYLIDVGFLFPIAAVGYALTARFAREAADLAALRDRLEALVAERTAALERTTRELVASERMSAMARLAGGMSHELNSPAAALGANLRFLAEVLRAGEPVPDEAASTLSDASALIDRIVEYVRHLANASRAAGASPHFGAVTPLLLAVREATPAGPRIRAEVPPELCVGIDAAVLTQILGLLLRGVARGQSGGVRVGVVRSGDTVQLALAPDEPDGARAAGVTVADLTVVAGLLRIYGATLAARGGGVVLTLPVARAAARA